MVYSVKDWVSYEKIFATDLDRMEDGIYGRAFSKVVAVDGQRGDEATIQAALSALAAAGGGACFVKANLDDGINPPQITINSALDLDDNVHLFSDGVRLIRGGGLATAMIRVLSTSTHSRIGGLIVDGNGGGGQPAILVGQGGASENTFIENCRITDWTNPGIDIIGGAKNVHIQHCILDNITQHGIFADINSGDYVTAYKNYLYNCGTAVGYRPVQLSNGDGHIIEANWIDGGQAGIQASGPRNSLSFTKNHILNTIGVGIHAEADNSIIADNFIDAPGTHGMQIKGDILKIVNNVINTPTTNGFYVFDPSPSYISLLNNDVYNAGVDAVRITGGTGTFKALFNRFRSTGGDAIDIQGGAFLYDICHNLLEPTINGTNGIIVATGALAAGSRFCYNWLDALNQNITGFQIDATGVENIMVNHNIIRSISNGDGILMWAADASTIIGNSIRNVAQAGGSNYIRVNMVGGVISLNAIYNPAAKPGTGIIEFGTSDWNNVTSNTIRGYTIAPITLIGANSQSLGNLVQP